MSSSRGSSNAVASTSSSSSSSAPTPSATPAPTRRVPISLLPPSSPHTDPTYLIWSPSDVLYLRTTHRIMGILTGSLPLLPQQNAYLGVPLQLMPEEVELLLRRGAARLVDDEAAHGEGVGREEWRRWVEERDNKRHEERREAHKLAREHRSAFEKALKKGGGGKKGGAQRADEEEEEEGPSPAAASDANAAADDVQEPTEEELAAIPYTHVTHGASDSLPWYQHQEETHDRLVAQYFPSISASSSSSSSSPTTTTTSSTRSLIYHHLNSPPFSYYLSCGLRFGGDFVAYPGDPFRYHSHYTITVPKDKEEGIAAGKLIADGRLGTAVKKVHVLGTVGRGGEGEEEGKGEREGERQPVYFSLTWAGFGT